MSTTFPSSGPSVSVVEALLFASEAPVEAERLQEVLGLGTPGEARELVEALSRELEAEGRALQVVEVGGGFRLVTRPEVAPWLVKLARSRTRSRLSRPALETLAIIAYRQPVSRPEVDAVRGVNSEGVLDNLLERRMIRIGGRKDSPGRPFLYETTREFLVAFGLRDISELPQVDGELMIPETEATAAQGELETEPAVAAAAEYTGTEAGSDAGDTAGDARDADRAAPVTPPATGDNASEGQTQQDPGSGGPDVPARG